MRPGRAAVAIGVLTLLLHGCAYVTTEEFDALWDADGDGWPIDDDCDDNNPLIHPFAADARGDGCDADCGREPDADDDDWPDSVDCDPQDPDIHPCSAMERDGDGIDSDCDGYDAARTDACPSADPDFPEAEALETC